MRVNVKDQTQDNHPSQRCEPIVFVIDDDEMSRAVVARVMETVGIRVAAFAAAEHFWRLDVVSRPACIVLDVSLDRGGGLVVQERLRNESLQLPVVFMATQSDIETAVKAMKKGAVDFLIKPFREQELLDAITKAIEIDRKRISRDLYYDRVTRCYDSLSLREREVALLVVRGWRTAQIAQKLGVSVATVKTHKRNAMKKMESDTVADFVLKASALGLCRGLHPGQPDSFVAGKKSHAIKAPLDR
jgi:FixJ family two-component response regulator